MKNKQKLLNYFKEHGITKKPKDITWYSIGQEIGISGNAARKAYKYNEEEFKEQLTKVKMPKILVFDIETAPLKGHMWRLWKQNIAPKQLLGSGNYFMLSWAAKWLYEDNVLSDRLTGEEALKENDYRIVNSIHKLLDEADIVIAHWGSGFDVPMLNGRFMMLGFDPVSSFTLIDTKVHAAKSFKFPSNKLDYIAQQFGVGQKIKTDWELWENCLKGDEIALEQMDIYCKMDVQILESVYLLMRPYIKPHPNVGLYMDTDVKVCPTCGSKDIKLNGKYVTKMNTFPEYKCNNCGSLSRGRKSNTSKNTKERLTSSIPK